MKIYTGNSLEDVRHVTNAAVFEDVFDKRMGREYGDCWMVLTHSNVPYQDIVCKTSDAIKAAPDDITIVRVGRSVRTSEKGFIIQTEMTKEEYLLLEG